MNLKKLRPYLPELAFALAGCLLLVRLFRLSVSSASDFEVYWYAIHAWVQGNSAYSQYSPVYNGLVFKYPPWILPVFLPFALFDLQTSKWIWTVLQVGAIFYSMAWLVKAQVNRRIVILVSFMFWWMWLAHTHFGQIMVFMMAFGLWAGGIGATQASKLQRQTAHTRQGAEPSFRYALLAFLLTSKIFSLVTLLGIWKKLFRPRTLLYGVGLLISAHLLLVLSNPKASLTHPVPLLSQVYQEWVHAASSGGAELGAKIVRGQQNHGFVAAILRTSGVGATQVNYDVLIALALAMILSTLWIRYSKKLPFPEQWAGWLALGVIIHPLAWHHSFTMAFPLCAFSVDRAWRSKNKKLILTSLFGTCCIGIFIPQVIGVDAVVPIEYIASKSWGVVICAITLILTQKGGPHLLVKSK